MINSRSQRALPYVLIFTLIITIFVVVKASNLATTTANQVRPLIESPCQRDPASADCAALRLEIIQNEPRYIPCTSLKRIVAPELIEKYTRCRVPGEGPRPDPAQERSPQQSNGGDDAGTPSQEPTPGPSSPDAPDTSGSSGGSSGSGGGGAAPGGPDEPPPTNPPTTPTPPTDPPVDPQPQAPSLLDPVTGPACQITTQLGIPVCL